MAKAAQTEVDEQDTSVEDDTMVVDDLADGEEQLDGEQQDADTEGSTDEGADGQDAEAEVVITFGEEPASAEDEENRAPEWVRELRKSNREKDRRIRELEQRVAAAAPAPQAVVVGAKPTMESCEYDAEKYETELEAWHTRKRESEEQVRTRTQTEEQQRTQWQTRINAVSTAASALKVKDYEDAAQAFEDQFSIVQQGIVIGGPDDPKISAQLRYALGKNPKKAKELAAIQDPVKFTFAVASLVKDMKVTPRKSAPAPDRVVRSSVAGAAAVDSQLARLQEQADKSGDRTKVAAYLRQKAAAKRAA